VRGRAGRSTCLEKKEEHMVTFAVIGTNFITENFLSAAKQCEEFRLGLVYSRSMERAAAFAQKWGAPKACDSFEQLCADREIQAVYLASPNSFHAAQAIALLKAGKHVLCEKPMATGSEELEQMLAAAKENHVILLEAMRIAFAPSMEVIRRNLYKLGPVRRAVLSYCQYSSRYDKFKNGTIENAFDPTLCNGALMDIGVYCVQAMVMLFGAPKKISASGYFLKNSIDAYGTVLADYDGMSAQLLYSKVNFSFAPNEIQGEKGCLLFEPLSVPRRLKIRYNNGEEEILESEFEDQDMYYELNCFIECIKNGTGAEKWNADTRTEIQVMDEVRRQVGIDFKPRP
jgi:scyllo-inositol 2-dehydrogenase (NADP+)